MKAKLLLVSIIVILFYNNSMAQNSVAFEEEEIKSVIAKLFNGMRKGDSSMVHSAFHSTARMQTVLIKNEKSIIQTEENINEFLKAVGTSHKEIYNERPLSLEIRIDENLATVWVPYQFLLGTTFSHSGVDAFQLFKSDQGWKIILCNRY